MGLIKGWEDGIMGQPEGSILQLVMPSSLGYGSRGAGEMIPPFSPLVFDIEIVSVK
jgi:FKBP-type peptidyl-prolyl cis-trans isomerase